MGAFLIRDADLLNRWLRREEGDRSLSVSRRGTGWVYILMNRYSMVGMVSFLYCQDTEFRKYDEERKKDVAEVSESRG